MLTGIRLGLLASALLACAAPRARPRPPPTGDGPAAAGPVLPRSSIAAVLERQRELELSAREIARLRELDDELVRALAVLKAQHRRRPSDAAQRERPAAPPAGRGGPGGGPPAGGPGMSGPGAGPEGGRGERSARASGADEAEARLSAALDEADTRAYLEAEEVLEPAHRDGAREIAAGYRAALYDQRASGRRPDRAR